MDRDNSKFYDGPEDEELEAANGAQGSDEKDQVDDIAYVSGLLRILRQMIEGGSTVPLTGKKLIDGEKCLAVLEDLEKNLPDAIQYGMQMYVERDRLLGNARQSAQDCVASAEVRARTMLDNARREAEQSIIDAENEANSIVADAQERADHMVEESEILRVAQEEARKIRNGAHVEANETRLKARHAAYTTLSGVEAELSEMLKAVRRQRMDIGDADE